MYSRKQSIQGKASASMVPNNLAVNLGVYNNADILFLHKSAVHLLLSGDEESADGYSQRHVVCKIPSANQQVSFVLILQADWVEVAGRKILVLATQKGIKMYDWDGSTLIYWHGFGAGGEPVHFTRGITSIGSNTICVGASSGQLLVFSVPPKGGNITFEEYLPGHDHSVTAVVARGDNLISADEYGDIIIRKHMDGASFKISHTVRGHGSPCNCVDVWQNLVVAGYANGEIKIYGLSNGRLLGEIGAHARSVNAIHIAQGTGMCLSASEDSYVRVWKLRAGESIEELSALHCPRGRMHGYVAEKESLATNLLKILIDDVRMVSHVFSECITDHQLVGAQFTDNDGRSFAVAAYDSSEIFRFSQ